LIARLRLDAALYAPAPPRQPGQNGRPPLKGERRPSLKAILEQDQAAWTDAAVAWYDGTTRIVELVSQTAVWYRSGKPPVLLRWVLIRAPQGAFDPQASLCTDPAAVPTQILQWFVLRWSAFGGEITFQEVRTYPGLETQRHWSDLAFARTTPILLGLFSWTTLAVHTLQQERPITQRTAAWYYKPSPTPSPWCDGTCGWRQRVFHCPQPAPICRNSLPPCTTDLTSPLFTPLELRKAQVSARLERDASSSDGGEDS